jgi:predicted PurR-regulated permease PerM
VILFYSGNAIGAVIVFAGGALGIGLIDNVLRPILVGRDIKMPDPLVLLSVLGGLATFGPGGVIIGPVIAALFLSVWEMFANERQRA